uniref:peptidylprolyl isomerase n=1 Tax=Corethron hystrix TaxID=216773 RepID=A0A7S1FQI5_9STRA|mmetsp:Transcript_22840/g.52344  ORF Transcript_22840/g.52344 Transcript_22840/m.52344 type:complete len:221 (+) Transcript_22840:102-764(+)|eukprot:CAMPEP_0113299258 /NCGR_PEP_ID=MMETSP0010_2-20120614/1368_1 /TAXON_ID=216773 ORGANISM="Corethron hystrix, Strain 308" /NCGR_SAMPLE_ID=MMETSP0010_2 /ASSEMBLY_ACC=CAM_ASM_000155 /LENGTH=220 /DNA_ID=CAMNT_0000152463 /DNA_START=58 /DNA_END=720 /DNA_ORIENTATION=- /assembly_acc=CAM_ASM_000155
MSIFGVIFVTLALSSQATSAFTTGFGVVTNRIVRSSPLLQKQKLHSSSASVSDDRSALDRESKWEVNKDFVESPSGLKTLDIVVGTGDSPEKGDLISVHYAGWYDKFDAEDGSSKVDGVSFDDSRARDPEPLKILYGEAPILEGWNEGIASMKAGGKREFIIPPHLGYGSKEVSAPGRPSIPANSYLRFVIELMEVDNSALTKFRLKVPKLSQMFDKPWF